MICVSHLSAYSPKIRKKLFKTCMKGPVEHQFQQDAKTQGGLHMLFPRTLGDFFFVELIMQGFSIGVWAEKRRSINGDNRESVKATGRQLTKKALRDRGRGSSR